MIHLTEIYLKEADCKLLETRITLNFQAPNKFQLEGLTVYVRKLHLIILRCYKLMSQIFRHFLKSGSGILLSQPQIKRNDKFT